MNIAIGGIHNHIFTLNKILAAEFKDGDKDPGKIR